MSVRAPAVAGAFYPDSADPLRRAIREACARDAGPRAPSRCVVSPHAGYAYSAHVACRSIRAIGDSGARGPVIVIGPEHESTGTGASVPSAASWRTPLGDVDIDAEAARELAEAAGPIAVDDGVHAREHSIEVQVPLLQEALGQSLRIVPVALSDQDQQTAQAVGQAAADVALAHDGAIVASSDLTHYEADASARKKDAALIARIESLDVSAMYETLLDMRISACGYGAIAAAMVAAGRMHAAGGRLLRYATSADAGGSPDSVVGYASVVFA